MKKNRVLLADDHEVVRAGIRKALEDLPELEIVGEVGDGPALLAALIHYHPDCLLIDVTMPDFEPITAIHKIRTRYPELKILAVSAYDDDVYVQGLLGAGVNGYHLKDQPLSDLRLAVQRVLAGERWLSSPLIGKLLSFSASPPAGTSRLTTRQAEIVRLLAQGMDNQSIAQETGLSVKTVENHLTRIYRQLNVQSRLEAVSLIRQQPEILELSAQYSNDLSASIFEPIEGKKILILLVDDNERYRFQLRRMAGKAYPQSQIYEASHAQKALELVKSTPFHLSFIDVVLGDDNGIRCARRLKALAPEMRIILMSAYPDREFHRLGLEAGAAAFLDKKDLNITVLRQVIDDVV
jgi:DNA-binding NarL/FixJ family response regulator